MRKQTRGLQQVNLTDLRLARTNIRGDGIVHLAGLRKLQVLSLTRTRVGDEAVERLGKLKTLKELRLEGTDVTPGGVSKLQYALPNCIIKASVPNLDEFLRTEMLLPYCRRRLRVFYFGCFCHGTSDN